MKKNDATFEDLYLDEIEIEGARRGLDADAVARIAASMEEIGLQTPITVRLREDERGQSWLLVSGMHRLEAAKKLGWEKIRAVEREWTKTEARKWEISENLHRSDLTEAERREHIAEWVRLTAERVKYEQDSDVSHRGTDRKHARQPAEEGIRKAASELGIPKSTVARAVAAESLPAEVRAAADEAELGTVKRATIAREPTPAAQLAAVEREKEVAAEKAKTAPPVPRGKKGRPAPLSVDDLDGLLLAGLRGDIDWEKRNRASKAQRCLLEYASSLYYGCEQLLTACAPGQRHAVATAISAMGEQVLREVEEAEAQEAEWDAENAEEAAALAE